MKRLISLLSAIPLLMTASPAWAQSITYDFDKDGRTETVTVINPDGVGEVGIRIARPGRAGVVARVIAVHTESSEPVKLEISRSGSLLVKTADTYPAYPSEQTLTIAFRQNDYRVIGITHSAYARQSEFPNVWCDINLATGRANSRRGNRAMTSFTVPPSSRPLSLWAAGWREPRQCDITRP